MPLVSANTIIGTDPKKKIKVNTVEVIREQQFVCTVTGLKPDTRHYVYMNGELQDADRLKPANSQYTDYAANSAHTGKFGEPILTNSKGKLVFTYLLKMNVPLDGETVSDYYYLANAAIGRKYLVVTDYYDNTYPLSDRASRPIYNNVLTDVLNTNTASYAVSYIDIKASKVAEYINGSKVAEVNII